MLERDGGGKEGKEGIVRGWKVDHIEIELLEMDRLDKSVQTGEGAERAVEEERD